MISSIIVTPLITNRYVNLLMNALHPVTHNANNVLFYYYKQETKQFTTANKYEHCKHMWIFVRMLEIYAKIQCLQFSKYFRLFLY